MDGWLTPRLDWSYQSLIEYAGEQVLLQQRGVNLLNARLSYGFFDDHAQVALWARNLIGEEYFNSVQPLDSVFGASTRYYAPPRTFGGELSYRF
ncbi:MAG: TonB-dependent receptor [Candidatus Binatia bacterium]|nr:TonB-dependent receptor [Candidatus Binatia bacterium]